ncbi:MAG: hypothetical protein AAGA75_17325 [Cyanobacteria bacterium P01_E01_bin.6]
MLRSPVASLSLMARTGIEPVRTIQSYRRLITRWAWGVCLPHLHRSQHDRVVGQSQIKGASKLPRYPHGQRIAVESNQRDSGSP